MNIADLKRTAKALVADGKGILAADETLQTLTKRFEALKIDSTLDSRRTYREMLFTTPGVSEFISGVIMQDETIRQQSSTGTPLADVLAQQGIAVGIKVDAGTKRLAGCPAEGVTEGLDGLRERLIEYYRMGARFAEWRAVFQITPTLPSSTCVRANAHALGRYAALCQEQGMLPIVEPEVLMVGSHTLQRCEEVTEDVLHATMSALFEHRVNLEGILLKPNMIGPAIESPEPSGIEQVALATLRCLRRHVPAAIPAIVFLSGGQDYLTATEHLNSMNRLNGRKPWKLTFSFGAALQDEALRAWRGKPENVLSGQRAFFHRAKCLSAAALGNYFNGMEVELAA